MKFEELVEQVVANNPDIGEVLFKMLEEYKELAREYGIADEKRPAHKRFLEVLTNVLDSVEGSGLGPK